MASDHETGVKGISQLDLGPFSICISKTENHIHENDFKCELCHLQAKTFAILPKEIFSISEKKINFKKATNYQFLYKHQQLSFSLRGPPFFNFL